MSRVRKPRGKIVRALGANIFGNPKFDRLLERKPHPPGKPRRVEAGVAFMVYWALRCCPQ